MALELTDLLRCPAIGKDLAVRACLRRQVAGRRTEKGKPEDWPALRPECRGCAVGEQTRAAAGVRADRCTLCGAGIVGAEPCSGSCAARRAAHEDGRVQPRDPPRPPRPDHLWTAAVPDVPFGPPPSQIPDRGPVVQNWTITGPVTAAARRAEVADAGDALDELEPLAEAVVQGPLYASKPRRAVAAAPQLEQREHPAQIAPANTSTPAPEPAEESPMRCSTCKKSGHNARSCNQKPAEGASPARPKRSARPLEGKTVSQLLALKVKALGEVREVERELKTRQEELAAALDVREVVEGGAGMAKVG